MEYVLSLIVISFIPSMAVLYCRRHLIKPLLILAPLFLLIGFVWDTIAVSRGWWVYGRPYLLGPTIGVIPVEDLLFFVLVPTSVLCIYELVFGIGKKRT